MIQALAGSMKENDLIKLEQLADLMDSRFAIPGTGIRIGLDPILGLIPGIGDTLSLGISAYIIIQSRKNGIHPLLETRMWWNVFTDWIVGLVPVAGDLFDVAFKANRKNIALLREHLKTTAYETDSKGDNALFI